ncbi:MAG: hypothetical protein ACW98X_24415 [Promethearchaeota archaeon]
MSFKHVNTTSKLAWLNSSINLYEMLTTVRIQGTPSVAVDTNAS